jgi:small conductance mechanosensitive channel
MIALLLSAPACANDTESWCAAVYGVTGNRWLALYSDDLIGKPLVILVIVVVALVTRYFLHRMIDRLTRGNGKPPKILQTWKARHGGSAAAATVTERHLQRARTIGSVLKSTASFVILLLATIYALQQLGVRLAPLLASAGVAGVAIAFGAQTLVRDFLSGLFMMAEDQYGVGDVVDLDVASGTVESIGLRLTTLRDTNGAVWYVRNGEITSVGNSSQGFAIAVVDFPVPHTTDIEKAMDLASKVASEVTSRDPLASDTLEAPQMLGVNEINANGVTLRLTVKVRAGRQWAIQRALRGEIKRAYDAEKLVQAPDTLP